MGAVQLTLAGMLTTLGMTLLVVGVYVLTRHWMRARLPRHEPLTMERLFQRLYRIAREVERTPETLDASLMGLMRELFDPLDITLVSGEAAHATLRDHGSVLLVPLPKPRLSRKHMSQLLVLKHAQKGRRPFSSADASLAERIVDQLQRALHFDEAVEQGRREERLRIAQDLHDDIGARLLTLMYQAQDAEVEEYIRHTIQDLKTLTRGLAAQSHRLSEAASEWKRDISQRLDLAHCELDWAMQLDTDIVLTIVQWSALTRILRELVSNIISHALAKQVTIRLSLNADRLHLSVADNGRGSAPESWAHGLGLGGVRKRVKQLGGNVQWVELEPKGICCEVMVDHFEGAAPILDTEPREGIRPPTEAYCATPRQAW
jgi:signal transduction histidine kinase